MFKLTVVSGPNRGTTYVIREGENSIGRVEGNAVVLPSSKVSKRHCVLVVDNEGVEMRDEGSANGTFVNGVLAKAKRIKAGDRVSVGPFVLELGSPPAAPRAAPAVAGIGNVVRLQFPPAQRRPGMAPAPSGMPGEYPASISGGMPGAGLPGGEALGSQTTPPAPKDFKGRALAAIETYVMPFFYGMSMKTEWRVVAASIAGVFVVVNVIVSVSPLLDANRESVIRESARRARFMAKLISEHNAPAIAARAESKTDISFVENAEGVRAAVLVDLENRIIAPSSKVNQYLAAGPEARFATRASKLFKAGQEKGLQAELDDALVVIEPIKVFNPTVNKNVAAGMAIVSIDTSIATMAAGEMGTVYSKTLIYSAILCALVFFVLYRLTLKPFQILNEDMDKALKGEMGQVTHEFKLEELDALWDIINSALQRIPKAGDGTGAFAGGAGGPSADDYVGPMMTLADASKGGMVVFDHERKIVGLNAAFEEISGIRADGARGQEISAVARDQSLGALVNDLFDRAQAGTEGVSEDFEMSGVSFKLHLAALGKPGEPARCFVLAAAKND